MAMSRSIMKKLYHKNVELEKELAIAKANQQGLTLTPPATASGIRPDTALRPGTSAAVGHEGGRDASPAAQALQERDLTIRQLQQALEASRRRCALLEMHLSGAGGGTAAGPGGFSAGGAAGAAPGGNGGAVSAERLRDVVVQSALHHQKYKQIRDDYNRLLTKRASAVQGASRSASGGGGGGATAALLEELRKRLVAEVQEREAEAALYSARLYESEKAMSDWYVEKRLLEEHIARLSAEVRERDRIDSEIEGCVASMLERLRGLEAENEALRSQLAERGVDVGSLDVDSG